MCMRFVADKKVGIYFASKAAANSISETLRLEMKPLGVRVVTAMVGAVTTPLKMVLLEIPVFDVGG